MTKRKAGIRRNGLKARVEKLLRETFPQDYSVYEICIALGLPKSESSDVSSVLAKLSVRSATGPAVSTLGRRHTKRYRYFHKAAPAPIVVRETDQRLSMARDMDDRRALAFTR